jgi:hypothetical protein
MRNINFAKCALWLAGWLVAFDFPCDLHMFVARLQAKSATRFGLGKIVFARCWRRRESFLVAASRQFSTEKRGLCSLVKAQHLRSQKLFLHDEAGRGNKTFSPPLKSRWIIIFRGAISLKSSPRRAESNEK